MRREFSAGGVLVRHDGGPPWLAAIRPGGKPEGVWALPKGLIDAGESAEQTALREVDEETGLPRPLARQARRRSLRLHSGASGSSRSSASSSSATRAAGSARSRPEFRHEVAEARWLPLEDAPRLLAYKGEREMAERALMMLAAGGPS